MFASFFLKKNIPVNGTLWFCFSTKRFFLRIQYFRDKTRKPVKSNHAHCLNPSQQAKHALDLRSTVSTIMNTLKVASCRLVYFSILDSLSKDIHRQSSYFPFINIQKILGILLTRTVYCSLLYCNELTDSVRSLFNCIT